MKSLLIGVITVLGLTACDNKTSSSSAVGVEEVARKRLEAAKRFDRAHDNSMKEATKLTVPEPKPAGPIP